MINFLLFVFLFSMNAWTQGLTPSEVLKPLDRKQEVRDSFDLTSFLGGLFPILSSLGNYNASVVTPSETCGPDWEPPQKISMDSVPQEVRAEEAKSSVQVEGKEKEITDDLKFKMDSNLASSQSAQQSCVQDRLPILDKCYPSVIEKLKKGEITVAEVDKLPHEAFKIKGHSKEVSEARLWDFHHQNRAKQDTGLTVMDGYHFGNGKVYGAEMMFFPRKQIPQYLIKGNRIEVTLANGEVVNFDAISGAIASGVLTENKPRKTQPPEIKYQGTGVMIQMIGLDGGGKSFKETATEAVIFKKGFPPCKVPSTDLWPDQKTGKSNSFKFVNDEGLDDWLKKSKCGFSL